MRWRDFYTLHTLSCCFPIIPSCRGDNSRKPFSHGSRGALCILYKEFFERKKKVIAGYINGENVYGLFGSSLGFYERT